MIVLLIALIPALGWGMMPILSKIMGGNANEQLIGTTLSALLFGVFSIFIFDVSFQLIPFIVCFFSGLFWAGGQYFQFLALKKESVSSVMPLSTGTQLLFITIVAGIFLSEWKSIPIACLTFLSLVFILLGIYFITKTNRSSLSISKQIWILLCISSILLMFYVTITGFFKISGAQVFFPQSLGMVVGGILISLRKLKSLSISSIARNLGTGTSWVLANSTLFYVSDFLGVGLTYSFSQMNLIVATFGSIYLLKEKKSIQEKRNVLIGSLIYVLGVSGMSLLK